MIRVNQFQPETQQTEQKCVDNFANNRLCFCYSLKTEFFGFKTKNMKKKRLSAIMLNFKWIKFMFTYANCNNFYSAILVTLQATSIENLLAATGVGDFQLYFLCIFLTIRHFKLEL